MTIFEKPNEADVKRLLQACDLPVSDITPERLEHFFAAADASGLIGVVGLELYQEVALLRSLAVSPSQRGTGLGKQLVAHAEQYALARGVRAIYLLTTTAGQFFSRLGYSAMSRGQAPAAIQTTTEFLQLCPSSSVLMVKQLAGEVGFTRQ